MLIILTKSFFIDFFITTLIGTGFFAIGELMNVDDPNSRYFVHSIVSRFNELRFCHSNARANKIEDQI